MVAKVVPKDETDSDDCQNMRRKYMSTLNRYIQTYVTVHVT